MYKVTQNIIFILCFVLFCLMKEGKSLEGAKILSKSAHKGFVVYLLNANAKKPDAVHHTDWLCGGAIISPAFVLTSAACVADVKYMYAVVGTRQLKPLTELKTINKTATENTGCLKSVLKKVILTCTPQGYKLNYTHVDQWTNIDIALAKVDSPFDFDPAGDGKCKEGYWMPTAIKVNFKQGYQNKDTLVLLYGWGHLHKWREEEDANDYNQKELRYTSSKIMDKNECIQSYSKDSGHLITVMEKYMFCTDGAVSMTGEGVLMSEEDLNKEGCSAALSAAECIEKKRMLRSRRLDATFTNTRRNGICQNDHGGPVTTFAGSQETLIGVASLFLLTGENHCTGPFLHTSTYCNSKFVHCIMENGKTYSRRSGEIRCPGVPPPEKGGFRIESRRISWIHHPDGPAADELEEDLIERPQIPIQSYL